MPRKQQTVRWADLGRPPEDTLHANEWAFRVLAESMYMTINDHSLTEVDRRREIRETAGVMRGLIPQARLREAEGAVAGDRDLLAHGAGPEMENAAQLGTGDGRPKAKRGRPRKRSVL